MKLLKVIFIVFGVVALIFLSFMFQPWVFLPHNHIEISLPFAASDDATTGLIPMGKKLNTMQRMEILMVMQVSILVFAKLREFYLLLTA